MFQVCHFHYWLGKCIKSDRCRSTAGWPHIQLPSLVQRQNAISALCGCHPGNEKLQIKILPWESFLQNCIFPWKNHVNGKFPAPDRSRRSYECIFHNWLRSLLHWCFSMGSLQLPILSLARWESYKLLQGSARLIRLNMRSKAWDILTMFILMTFCKLRQHQNPRHLWIFLPM